MQYGEIQYSTKVIKPVGYMNQAIESAKFRQSISFTQEQHKALSELAHSNKVSFCWVVRHACDLLIREAATANGKNLIDLSIRESMEGDQNVA